MGISLFLGGSKRLPRWFGALTVFGSIQPCRVVKMARIKVPQSARMSAGGGGPIAIWAMPKWRGRQGISVFPYKPILQIRNGWPPSSLLQTIKARRSGGESWEKLFRLCVRTKTKFAVFVFLTKSEAKLNDTEEFPKNLKDRQCFEFDLTWWE